MKKYIIPQLDDFRIGFVFEQFETILREEYKNKDGHFIIPDFELYSDAYFEELHSKDKYWKHRKWVKKTTNKNTIFNLPSTYQIEQYTPLNIENIYRVNKESLLNQLEAYYILKLEQHEKI